MPILDQAAYLGLLDQVASEGEPYFDPRYLALHEGTPCFFGADGLVVGGSRIEVPDAGCADLQTPNGYGGPLVAVGQTDAQREAAWADVRESARRAGVIAIFCRLHPVLGNERWMPSGAEIRDDRPTVYVDLDAGMDEALRRAHPRHRNKVARAQKHGLVVRWDAPEDWDRFVEIYAGAMDRMGATTSLRFDRPYFEGLRALPTASLAAAHEGGEMTAGHVYLFGRKHAHYHLGARLPAAADWTTSYLMHVGLGRAHERGLSGMHLGGGATTSEEDGVLRWKRSFGGRELSYRVGLVVTDPPRYQQLAREWAERWGREPVWLLPHRQPPPKEAP